MNNSDVEIGRWKKVLQDTVPLHLDIDFARPGISNTNKAKFEFFIDKKIGGLLNQLSKDQNVSLFTTLLSAFKVLLFRYSNQEDICVGSAITSRAENSPDNNVNLLAFRSCLNGADQFITLLQKVNIITQEAYEHQGIPFEKALNSLVKEPSLTENPLFLVMFLLLKEGEANLLESNLKTEQILKYDLALVLNESSSGIKAKIEYSAALYKVSTIKRMAGHYVQLLKSIINIPSENIGALPMLTTIETTDLLLKFNNTLTHYPKEKTIVDLFEEQVLKTPDQIALRKHNQTMTYLEVNQKANQLARYLVDGGVNNGDNIGLLVTRGFEMIIGMYGIMKAGAAYVPIDPDYPIERQEYILSNSMVKKVVADGDYPLCRLIPIGQVVKTNSPELREFGTNNLGIKVNSKQLAYTIYTSGSTGRPKGVMIEHHSAVNLILWVNTEFNIGSQDRLLFITSMCFDLSVYDIFGLLAAGGSIVIVEQHELVDVHKLKDMLINYNITFWDSVPTTMDFLVRELESENKEYLQQTLRIVFMSGDWIPVNLPNRIKKYFPNTRVISLGGATEGTVWSNFFPIEKVEPSWTSIPYGKPISNNFFYILNEQLQPVPIGVIGELYIGGVGVANGYANDKKKTDYSFVKDPFNDQAGERMYRTGDLGRMMPNLNMEFIGRKDDQVKIRGYRIELGEIESVLRECQLVNQAVVLLKENKDGKKELVSYIVGKDQYDRQVVILHLKGKLPDYMIPTVWIELDSLPLNTNGKIDKKALLDYNVSEQIRVRQQPPRTDSEKMLVEIWEDVLRLKNVGINDNFFEIGGHSLLAVQIMTKIENKTGKKFPISILFRFPDIESLNGFIQKDNADPIWQSLVPIKPTGSKMPLYIVHGDGLNVLNFSNLALYVDSEQPVFGLQAKGLDGVEQPLDNMVEIAKNYVTEIVGHNPNGPYAIAGYSIGGFIAMEMAHQFEIMNKQVKFLAIFDTDADYTGDRVILLSKRVKRRLYRILKFSKSLFRHPFVTIKDKIKFSTEGDNDNPFDQLMLAKKSETTQFYDQMAKVKEKLYDAFKNYHLTTFNGSIYLFRAKICIHYTDDIKYLGWRKYAKKGVKGFEIPGEHNSILMPQNVTEFAQILQKALNNC
jgi:amino acid adenylation domain-containing protein